MELLWLQSKLWQATSVNSWTQPYHHMSPRNIKTFEQYDYIIDIGQRASGELSILSRKNILQNKININTHLQVVAVSASLHKTITICSLLIPPYDPIIENALNNLIEQFPKPFILMGDFNSHNIIQGSKTTNKRGQILEKIINSNNLCLHNQNSQTHLNPFSGSYSVIDLTLNDPSMFTDYNWRIYKDSCSSDHYPIIIENSTIKSSEPQIKPPRWNFKRANWKSYKKLCLTLIPESNKNQEEYILPTPSLA